MFVQSPFRFAAATPDNPYPDWDYYFDVTLPAAKVPSAQTSLPIPLRFEIPLANWNDDFSADVVDTDLWTNTVVSAYVNYAENLDGKFRMNLKRDYASGNPGNIVTLSNKVPDIVGDFTIQVTATLTDFVQWNQSGNDHGIYFYLNGSQRILFYRKLSDSDSGKIYFNSTTTNAVSFTGTGESYVLKMVRKNGVISFYCDSTLLGTNSYSSNITTVDLQASYNRSGSADTGQSIIDWDDFKILDGNGFSISRENAGAIGAVYNQYEVLNLPFAGHATDLSFGTAKAAPATAHAVALNGDSGVSSGYLSLDGNGDYSSIIDDGDFDLPGSFVVSAWAYLTGTTMYVFGSNPESSQGSVTKPSYGFSVSTTSIWFGYCTDYGQWPVNKTGAVVVSQNEWHHVVVSRDDSNDIRLFVDDDQIGAVTNYVGTITNAYSVVGVGGIVNGSANYGTGRLRDLVVLKGTSIAPTASYRYALQDLRIAQGATDVPFSAPLRGLNPITGVCDCWVKPAALSSTADNVLCAYIGNSAAAVPSSAVAWPAAWKRVWHRPEGIIQDLVNAGLLVPTNAAFGSGGATLAANQYLTAADSADFAVASAGDFAWVFSWYDDSASSNAAGGFWSQRYDDNSRVIIRHYNSGTLAIFFVSGGGYTFYGTATVSIATGTEHTLIITASGGTVTATLDGSNVALTVGDAYTAIPNVAADARIGYEANAGSLLGTLHNVTFINGAALTIDQQTIIDEALRTPSSTFTVGTLEANI
jgi:hypothetical protein